MAWGGFVFVLNMIGLHAGIAVGMFCTTVYLFVVTGLAQELLAIGPLTAATGASGADAATLYPSDGDINRTLPNWAGVVVLTPTVASVSCWKVAISWLGRLGCKSGAAAVTLAAASTESLLRAASLPAASQARARRWDPAGWAKCWKRRPSVHRH